MTLALPAIGDTDFSRKGNRLLDGFKLAKYMTKTSSMGSWLDKVYVAYPEPKVSAHSTNDD
jgi:hypothetical protein